MPKYRPYPRNFRRQSQTPDPQAVVLGAHADWGRSKGGGVTGWTVEGKARGASGRLHHSQPGAYASRTSQMSWQSGQMRHWRSSCRYWRRGRQQLRSISRIVAVWWATWRWPSALRRLCSPNWVGRWLTGGVGRVITYNSTKPLHSTEQLYKLHVDRQLLFEANDFTQALVSLNAAYRISNIQYNSKIFNFLTFLEKKVFRLTGTETTSMKCDLPFPKSCSCRCERLFVSV